MKLFYKIGLTMLIVAINIVTSGCQMEKTKIESVSPIQEKKIVSQKKSPKISPSKPTNQALTEREKFNKAEQQRFNNEIANAIPELSNEGIKCYKGDCSVVYFHFKTIPDDLQTIIRMNTALLSTRKLKALGISHVSIIATYNGRTIYTCDGSKGKIDKCKSYY